MGVKAVDATVDPQWFRLECSDDLRVQVKALSAAERQALIDSVDRASVLGFMLADERQTIGADEPTEQARNAARVKWAMGLSERKRAALAAAESYNFRIMQAWVDACVVGVEVDGEPFAGPMSRLLGAIQDPSTLGEVLAEVGLLCSEFSSLGKAGPMCSARLCGAPTPTPEGGPASDAPRPAGDCEGIAETPSPTMPDSSPEPRTASPSEASAGG